MVLEDIIKGALIEALTEFKGNREKVAKSLGMSVRTIQVYIHRFNLSESFSSSEFVDYYGKTRVVKIVYDHKRKKDEV